jgi:hypothetical protein
MHHGHVQRVSHGPCGVDDVKVALGEQHPAIWVRAVQTLARLVLGSVSGIRHRGAFGDGGEFVASVFAS